MQLTVLEIPLSLKLSCEDKGAATTVDNRLCNSCETLLKIMVETSRMYSVSYLLFSFEKIFPRLRSESRSDIIQLF